MLVGARALPARRGAHRAARGIELKINWSGRWAVWPTMSAIFFALCGLHTVAAVLIYIGLALSLMAAGAVHRDALVATRAAPSS